MSLSRFLVSIGIISLHTLTSVPSIEARTPIGSLRDDRSITISGRVTSVVGNDFIIADSTGQVIVDAGPRWWQAIDLKVGETVTIIGEYDRGEVDAFSISRENGQVIQIRPRSGPPPWANRQ
jgi:uncharacterized protein YdeI (BOF family)